MKLFYADTETTGLEKTIHEVTQFAFIVEIDGKVVGEHNFLMRPDKPDVASPDALRVTGKTIADLLAYPDRRTTYNQVIATLAKYVDRYDKNDKFQWVGHNAPLDMGFVRAYFESMGDKFFGSWFDNRPVDTLTLAVAASIKGHFKTKDYKLGTLCEHFAIPLDAHDALNDIRATRALFNILMDRYMVTPLKERPPFIGELAPDAA